MQRSGLISVVTATIGLCLLLLPTLAPAQGDAENDPELALSRAGDAKKGERVFGRCRACHVVAGRQTSTGPSLQNIFGRPAGTEPGYGIYSKALRESGIVWNERTLDEWMSSPLDFLPGNKMNLAPVRNAQDRMDLLAYLREATE